MDKILEEKMKKAIEEDKIITEISETGLEIDYFEDEETGILYPIFKIDEDLDIKESEIPYGIMWKDYMLENKHHYITTLIMTGNLTKKMLEIEEKAQNYKDNLVKQLLDNMPMPPSSETLERASHFAQVYQMAEEFVIKDIIEKSI